MVVVVAVDGRRRCSFESSMMASFDRIFPLLLFSSPPQGLLLCGTPFSDASMRSTAVDASQGTHSGLSSPWLGAPVVPRPVVCTSITIRNRKVNPGPAGPRSHQLRS